jgi:hypothetical protein
MDREGCEGICVKKLFDVTDGKSLALVFSSLIFQSECPSYSFNPIFLALTATKFAIKVYKVIPLPLPKFLFSMQNKNFPSPFRLFQTLFLEIHGVQNNVRFSGLLIGEKSYNNIR